MEQVGDDEPVWTITELAADLSRETEKFLIWYSCCPRGCHQCYGCLDWLLLGENCKVCPPCLECGGPLVLVDCEVDEENEDEEGVHFACMRCEDAADNETESTLQ